MTSGGHNRKITDEQRDEMLRLHLSGDVAGAREMASSLGVHRLYAATRASQLGYKPIKKPVPTQHQWVQL